MNLAASCRQMELSRHYFLDSYEEGNLMSVHKNDREESSVQFLYNARNLQIYTIRKCSHFPKRYTFYISQPIVKIATDIYDHVKRANSIYPTNQHEAQLRRDHFLQANAATYSLVSQIELAAEIFSLEYSVMENWMKYVDDEIRLLKGIMESDRDRYKNLPES